MRASVGSPGLSGRNREVIQEQVDHRLQAAETADEKQELYELFLGYLNQRALELQKMGGKDSPEYKRENNILRDTIETYKLKTQESPPPVEPPVTREAPPPQAEQLVADESSQPDGPTETIFCTNCGTKNPAHSKFCYNCGTRLVDV